MYKVSELLGVSKNKGRGLVIYLSNSIGRASNSWRSFEEMLGMLARDLRTTGGVVIAFDGSDDQIAADVLRKPWTQDKKRLISRRLGLLIIDKNFDDFDPRTDNYFHIDLSGFYNSGGMLDERAAQDLVVGLHQIFLGDGDMFTKLNDMKLTLRRKRAASSVKVAPSFYGIGIDVIEFIRATRG